MANYEWAATETDLKMADAERDLAYQTGQTTLSQEVAQQLQDAATIDAGTYLADIGPSSIDITLQSWKGEACTPYDGYTLTDQQEDLYAKVMDYERNEQLHSINLTEIYTALGVAALILEAQQR